MRRVEAIRADPAVGRGSCSHADECYSDAELIEALTEAGVKTPYAAVAWAREMEGLQMEQALNQRWGEDTDPQVGMYKEWQARDKAPIEVCSRCQGRGHYCGTHGPACDGEQCDGNPGYQCVYCDGSGKAKEVKP